MLQGGHERLTNRQTDRQTDGQTDRQTGWIQYTPPNFVAGGIKNWFHEADGPHECDIALDRPDTAKLIASDLSISRFCFQRHSIFVWHKTEIYLKFGKIELLQYPIGLNYNKLIHFPKFRCPRGCCSFRFPFHHYLVPLVITAISHECHGASGHQQPDPFSNSLFGLTTKNPLNIGDWWILVTTSQLSRNRSYVMTSSCVELFKIGSLTTLIDPIRVARKEGGSMAMCSLHRYISVEYLSLRAELSSYNLYTICARHSE